MSLGIALSFFSNILDAEDRPSGYETESESDSVVENNGDKVQWLDDNDVAPEPGTSNKSGWKNYVDLESGGQKIFITILNQIFYQ